MVRPYDSSRRKKISQQTRDDIIRAALKLHWRGVTEFDAIAREAGCSTATVRKNFATKEALYRNCTQTFADTLSMPDLDALSKISRPAQRIKQAIYELCRIHDSMFGYAWISAYERQNSPALDAVMGDYEGLADAIAQIVTPAGSAKAPVVRSLLDFLTYRALRTSGNLSAHQLKDELVAVISTLVGVDDE